MKKISTIAIAGIFVAATAVPVAVHADPTQTISVDGNVEVDKNALDAYADGINFDLDLTGAPDVVSVTVGTDTFNVIDHKVSFNLPVLKADGTISEGENLYPITLVNNDGTTVDAQVKYNVVAVEGTVEVNLDMTIQETIDIKTSEIDAYKDGFTFNIDASQIQNAGDYTSITTEFGDTFDIVDGKATFKLPVIGADGKVMVGTNRVGLTFNKADGTKSEGSVTYNVTHTDDSKEDDPVVTQKAMTFGSDISVKVNGTTATSGKTVVAGDKLSITVDPGRGKDVTGISVNGTALTLDGNSAEYTVKDTDTEIKITSETKDAASSIVSIPANVSASVISDSGNILLANGSKVYNGEKVKISAAAPNGQTLKSLKLNGAEITNGQTVTVSDVDLNIEVEFESIKEISVTIPDGVTVTKNGTVLKSGDKVKEGDTLKISAAKQGYSVKSLTVNGAAFVSGSNYIVTDADVTIAVEFVADKTSTTYPVNIKAYDNDDSALKGVIILIKDSNKKTVATAETDKKGTISLDVAPGRYTYAVTEVPDGYISPSGSYTFTVSDTGKVKGTTNITISQSEVTLKKIDSITKNGVEGISIVVKNEDKETVETGVTNSKGELVITGLPEGNYTYSERYAASGYASDDTVYKFSIDEDGDVKGTTTTEVTPISIVFSVRDYASGKGIKGATLMIKNQLGRTVATITTDDKGEASVPGLSAGRYTLIQSEAPAGYAKSTEEYTFNVLESGLVSGTTSISNKEKASSNSGSNMTNGNGNSSNGSQSATTPGASGNQSSTAPGANGNTNNGSTSTNGANGNGTTTTTTTTTTTVTQPTGGKTQGTVKTGVETVAPKSKAPIIAGIVGAVGVVAGAASVAVKKIRSKKNDIQ